MALRLPANILSYIGTFLDKEDRLGCVLVCKHWKDPFLNAFWGRIHFGLYGMDITTLDSNKAYLINAHRVWAVKFCPKQLDDYEKIPTLQRSFPGIRFFEFYDFAPYISTTSDAFDWILWKSLTHLDIGLSHDYKTLSLQTLFKKLSVLPCLVHLTLYRPQAPSDEYTLSWNDFESLHYHLPRLEYLEHDLFFKPITKDDIEDIKTVEPAQTTTKICFSDNVDTLWLFYFASKYPNLRHFTIKEWVGLSNYNPINYNNQQHQSDLQLLSTLDQFFPCLKSAVTWFQPSNQHSRFIFYEILGHFGTEIEHIELRYRSDLIKIDINRFIRPISESLKVLWIDFATYSNQSLEHAAMFFDICPRLVELYIDVCTYYTIEVDNILESFSVLRLLSVHCTEFSHSSNTHTYTPHPLQRLEIKYSTINKDALNYISLCCNQLKHLTLVDFHSNRVDETGQVTFDMSMTKLDTFIYTVSDENIFRSQICSRHHMIQQMENDSDILQETQQQYRINWYHICCDRTNREERLLKWELGRREIEFCQRYFKDFCRRTKRGKGRKEIKKDRLGFVQKRFWKKDLQYGVLIFQFKSVKNYIFRVK